MKNKKTLIIVLTEILVSIIIFVSVVLFCFNFFNVGSDIGKDILSSGEKGNQTSASSEFTDEEINGKLNKIATTVIYNYRASQILFADSSAANLTFVVPTDSPDTVAKNYADYLESLSSENVNYTYISRDLDSDGKNEYLIEIQDSLADFCEAAGDSETAAHIQEIYDDGSDDVPGVLIYGSYADGQLVFHGFRQPVSADGAEITLEEGNLIFSNDGSKSRIFVGFPDKVYTDYDGKTEDFNYICNSFCNYEITQGYEVRFYAADVADVPGSQVIVSASLEGDVYSQLYTVTDGVMHLLYFNPFEQNATYITEIDSAEYIMTYTQQLTGSGDEYSTFYSYSIFRINENYEPAIYEEMSTIVKADAYTEENGIFFEKFNAYLKDAVVCSDPYELKGYTLNPYSVDPDGETVTLSDYLTITNCNTSKQGIVKVSEDSYLNFRNGPSVSSGRILVDSSDSSSYVRQNNGASVTVIDTVNTDNKENPVWLKVRIKYLGQTLTGYSSKKYIELSDVKSIAVGEKFTLVADSDQTDLKWSCNDESVAKIDADTGEITGIREGLVTVSVASESGLSDTCIVMVEKE